MLRSLNKIFIVLVPKTSSAYSFSHLRPISLCNVSFKIIFKILANRLRPFLGKFISPIQVAFVQGRWIEENFIMLSEIVHSMKKMHSRRGVVGIKVNLRKAFDSVK